jgi:hypothetical protein
MIRARWAFVAFWSKNMAKVAAGGLEPPGFSYEVDELKSMEGFAASVSDRDYGVMTLVNALLFIVGAGLLSIALVLSMMRLSTNGPVSGVVFAMGLAVMAVVAFAGLFPLTMTVSGLLVLRRRSLPSDADSSTLRALHRRVLWQFFRLGGSVVAAVLVVGLIIGRDDGALKAIGPIVEVAGPVLAVVMLLMMASGRRR